MGGKSTLQKNCESGKVRATKPAQRAGLVLPSRCPDAGTRSKSGQGDVPLFYLKIGSVALNNRGVFVSEWHLACFDFAGGGSST
ncbi:hypothetical protein C8J48_1520 [Desmospora activa DSM 45169]|uniref:Uncharacterized protein n=1 Tax=Desmospora activa DSM 45169 TaxID=1121389 RepID=A0A2T4ZAK0_9BACL|nr:hypothetical protein C8J48_1520 [Desmospora activa DSM 45169]